MKRRMVFFATVFLAVTLAMPARGIEQSTPKTGIQIPQVPAPVQVPTPVYKPDLVIRIIGHGSVYAIAPLEEIAQEAMNITFTITNRGRVATGKAGSHFSVGVDYSPLCQAPNCNDPGNSIGQAISALGCAIIVGKSTKSFHFSPPITINTPLAAGETRTITGVLVLPQCLKYSTLGKTASVYLIVDDKNQVDESDEKNNRSGTISVSCVVH
jgi:hypothetical protein